VRPGGAAREGLLEMLDRRHVGVVIGLHHVGAERDELEIRGFGMDRRVEIGRDEGSRRRGFGRGRRLRGGRAGDGQSGGKGVSKDSLHACDLREAGSGFGEMGAMGRLAQRGDGTPTCLGQYAKAGFGSATGRDPGPDAESQWHPLHRLLPAWFSASSVAPENSLPSPNVA